MRSHRFLLASLLTVALVAGCESNGGGLSVPDDYVFERDGASTVRHTGQTTRHVLIADLVAEMKRIAALSDGDTTVDEPGEVTALLEVILDYDAATYDDRALPSFLSSATPGLTLAQGSDYTMLGDANLIGKIAGNDEVTDHRDWDGGGADDMSAGAAQFQGWTETASGADPSSPEALLRSYLDIFEAQVIAYQASGVHPPGASAVDYPLYVTPEGLDLVQLAQKLALGIIAFSQATDDYLDDDTDDKGLLADNITIGSNGDTALEHAWDEAWGYFGGAINYGDYTDEELRADGDGRAEYGYGYNDANGDDQIDLYSEYNFGASVNAAKRDYGTRNNTNPTDFTGDADLAFRTGRAIIANAAGRALTADELMDLQAQRDAAVEAYEGAIAATVVHYINDTLADMAACDTADYSFADHAKHWSEMKGFALGLQFNPRSPFSDGTADFAALHMEMGDAPVLCGDSGALATYQTQLEAARTRMMNAYGFDMENVLGW